MENSNRSTVKKHDDLIYDVGMHKGEDSYLYLRKGFRVVAFEANPSLVELCSARLKEFIDQGRLTIVQGAIVAPPATGAAQSKVQFYKNENSVWGTVCADWAERNARLGTSTSLIEVDAINFADVIKQHGMPYYMKIDIEGCDTVCLNALSAFRERPDYVSFESDKTSFANITREIDLLSDLGYAWFQPVEQSALPISQVLPYPPREGGYASLRIEKGSSGLFGRELPNRWRSKRETLRVYRFIRLGYYLLGDAGIMNGWSFRGAARARSVARRFISFFTGASVPGWYDTHARHVHAHEPEGG